jgi:hypothetical protein
MFPSPQEENVISGVFLKNHLSSRGSLPRRIAGRNVNRNIEKECLRAPAEHNRNRMEIIDFLFAPEEQYFVKKQFSPHRSTRWAYEEYNPFNFSRV